MVHYSGTTSGSLTADTEVPVMAGATSSVAGAAGLVPSPSAGDDLKFLTGAGTFDVPSAGSVAWGLITGTLSSQTDLQTALNGKAATTHTHVANNITDFNASVSANSDVAANTAVRHAAVTLAGENYLSLSGQQITANPMILSGTNISGNLAVIHLNSGTGATSATFWRGDGTWAAPSGGGAWGAITGTLSSQTDLQTALNSKSPTSHTHSFSTLNECSSSTQTYDSDTAVNEIKYQLAIADTIRFTHAPTGSHKATPTLAIYRSANYTGTPSAGWKNPALSVITTVASGANGDEWGAVGAVRSSGNGEAVGVFGQGWRVAGASPAWGMVGDAEDQTNAGEASGRDIIGAEIDCFANGVNTTYQNRIGAMIVSGRPTVGAGASGANSQCWFGLYVTSVFGGSTGYYKHGVYVGNNEALGQSRLTADIGVKVLADGTYGFWDVGSKATALYASGAYTGNPLFVNNSANMSSTVSTVVPSIELQQKIGSNQSSFIVDHIRATSGADWDTTTMRLYRKVDSTIMGALEFRNLTDISFNRSIAVTMGGADFVEANFFKNYTRFSQPINMASQSANPAANIPSSGFNGAPNTGECNQYIKGGKMVWQYNDAGTIRYLSIPLTGTGTTFTHSTTSP